MDKIKRFICSVDMFRCVFIFLMMFSVIYKINDMVGPWVKFIILPWGYFLLARDLLGKRVLLKAKYIWLMIAFLGLYAVTILIHPKYLVENLKIYAYMVLHLVLLYPSDMAADFKNKCRAIFAFNWIVIMPLTAMSAASLWAQLWQFGVVVQYEGAALWLGCASINQLNGFYLNPNMTVVGSFVSIALLVVNLIIARSTLELRRQTVRVLDVLFFIVILMHVIIIPLTGSRAGRLAFITFAYFISFFMFAFYFRERVSKGIAGRAVAAALAVMVAGAVYVSDKPIRIGVAYAQEYVTAMRSKDGSEKENAPVLPAYTAAVRGTAKIMPQMGAALGRSLIVSVPKDELNPLGRDVGWTYDNDRLPLIYEGYQIVRENPIFGISPAALVDKAAEDGMTENQMYGIKKAGVHNVYLEIAVTIGIPGFLIFIAFLLCVAIENIKKVLLLKNVGAYKITAGLLSVCAMLAVHNLFERNIFLITIFPSVIFWSSMSFAAYFLNSDDGNAE